MDTTGSSDSTPPTPGPGGGEPGGPDRAAPDQDPAGPEHDTESASRDEFAAEEPAGHEPGADPADEPADVESQPVGDEMDTAPGLTWGKVAVLGLALAFLGFAVGFVVTQDRPPPADSADVGFLQDMLTHHDQALGVATLTVAYGEDPVVRSYAREVLTFQAFEIGVMTQMLAEWGYTTDDRSDEAMAWMDMGVPLEQMPGLLTDDQLAQVGEARGSELDRLFLDLMAEHHRGGLHMAQEGAARAEDDGVADLAARIERNQAGEINEYRLTADELGFDLDIAPADVPPADLPPTDD